MSADARGLPLDCVVRLMTPERIVVVHPLAGPSRRLVAYLIDQLLIAALIATTALALLTISQGSIDALGPVFAGYFVLNWGYGAFCEGTFNGQTIGKRALGIRVVSDRGIPISAAQAVVRNLVGAVDGLLPFFFLLGLASMVLSGKFQRVGDLAAGTMVVIEERRARRGVREIKDRAALALLPWLPARIAAGSDLARALSDYVDVRHRFSRERQEEMAEPLAGPLRARFALPPSASADAVLCAVYHAIFVGHERGPSR
jgi:uncharacterized RDD family membrane protein YckC